MINSDANGPAIGSALLQRRVDGEFNVFLKICCKQNMYSLFEDK